MTTEARFCIFGEGKSSCWKKHDMNGKTGIRHARICLSLVLADAVVGIVGGIRMPALQSRIYHRLG